MLDPTPLTVSPTTAASVSPLSEEAVRWPTSQTWWGLLASSLASLQHTLDPAPLPASLTTAAVVSPPPRQVARHQTRHTGVAAKPDCSARKHFGTVF